MDEQLQERRQNVKGLHARFLRENPRFINAPICNINYSTDGNATTLECLKWINSDSSSSDNNKEVSPSSGKERKRVQFAASIESPLSANTTCPAVFHHKAPKTTLDKILLEDHQVKTKEYISYKHQYNCRTNPNEPLRGKLHGSFVWDIS